MPRNKQSSKAGSTRYEVLLAIAMSEFYRTTHVMFMPPGKEYLQMLGILKNKKLIEPIGENFYKLTKKGWKKLKALYSDSVIDQKIDEWVDNL